MVRVYLMWCIYKHTGTRTQQSTHPSRCTLPPMLTRPLSLINVLTSHPTYQTSLCSSEETQHLPSKLPIKYDRRDFKKTISVKYK